MSQSKMSNENVNVQTESPALVASELLQNTETPKTEAETEPDIGNETSQKNVVKTNDHQKLYSDKEGPDMLRSDTNDKTYVPVNDENVCESQKLLETVANSAISENQTIPAIPSNGARYSISSNTSGTRRLSFQPHCEKINTNFLLSAFGSVTTIKSVGKTQTVNCRTVLWFLIFFGFMINYLYRVNINIAIVEMVINQRGLNIETNHSSECIVAANAINDTAFDLSSNQSLIKFDRESNVNSVHFDWDTVQQGHIIGSFFWFHWTLQIVGGIIAPRLGTKLIFGLSNFIPCFLCVFIPMAAQYHVNFLILLRVLQGFICGLSWPSMHHLCAQWIPPNERSKFVTAYLGSSVGIALCYPFFGWIMSHWSWEPVFYLSTVLGTIWYVAWLYYVYDSPAQHPRIDPMELIYIQNSLGDTLNKNDEKVTIPWSAILQSKPVWINIFSQFGGIWCLFTLMAQAPTYFKQILGWNVQMAGLLSGIPHLFRMIFAFGFSMFADSLLRNKRMSRTNVRKMACAVCNIVNGVFVVLLAFSGCDSIKAICFIIAATAVHGAISSGPLAGFIDISPNYSSILLGFNGLVGVLPGFISPWIVGKLTKGNQTVQQWQYIFLLTAGMLFITGIAYVLFSDSSLQSWNQSESKDEIETEKKMPKKTFSRTSSMNAEPLKN